MFFIHSNTYFTITTRNIQRANENIIKCLNHWWWAYFFFWTISPSGVYNKLWVDGINVRNIPLLFYSSWNYQKIILQSSDCIRIASRKQVHTIPTHVQFAVITVAVDVMSITACQGSCGKVMFSVVSVCHSVQRADGFHVIITHNILCITVQLDMGSHCTEALSPLLMSSGGQNWRPVQLLRLVHPRTPLTSADIWWLWKHVQSAQVGSMHPTGMLSCFI